MYYVKDYDMFMLKASVLKCLSAVSSITCQNVPSSKHYESVDIVIV